MPCMQEVNEDAGHTNVAESMDPWTNQIGYPVITINTINGEIHQKQFLFNNSSESRYVLNGHNFSPHSFQFS